MLTFRAFQPHGAPWSMIIIKSAQLILTKTKADSVLFAGHSGSTIEEGTIELF